MHDVPGIMVEIYTGRTTRPEKHESSLSGVVEKGLSGGGTCSMCVL